MFSLKRYHKPNDNHFNCKKSKKKKYPGSGPLGPDSQLKNCLWLKSDARFGISTLKLVTEQMQKKFPSVFDPQTVYLIIILKITPLPLPSPIGLTLRWHPQLQEDGRLPKVFPIFKKYGYSDSA